MENASKALIIAGAILLSILLISLGIMVFNQAQSTIDNSGMAQAEIEAFNNKFLKYEGIQKGTAVKSMINEVIIAKQEYASLTIYKNTATSLDNLASITVSDTNAITKTSIIDTKKTYGIRLSYGPDGRVNKIYIIEKTST